MLYFETQRACANSNSKKSHQKLLKGLWRRKNAEDLLAELHPDLGRMELEAKCVLESAGDRDHPSEGLVQVPKPEHKVLLNSSQPQLERAGSLGRAVRRSSSLKCRNSSGSWHRCLAQKQNNRRQRDWWLFWEASTHTEFILARFFSNLKKNKMGCIRLEMRSSRLLLTGGLRCLPAWSLCTLPLHQLSLRQPKLVLWLTEVSCWSLLSHSPSLYLRIGGRKLGIDVS